MNMQDKILYQVLTDRASGYYKRKREKEEYLRHINRIIWKVSAGLFAALAALIVWIEMIK